MALCADSGYFTTGIMSKVGGTIPIQGMAAETMQPKRVVAVVMPVARLPLSVDEEISLRHLRKYLGAFDRYVIGLRRLPKELSDFRLRRFPARYFSGRYEYNRLLLTERFYRAFAGYKYILIYQLDCLVFAGNLEEWCGKGWDYVGAPWLADNEDASKGLSAVGNGGLSLRSVQSTLAVLTSTKLVDDPDILAQFPGWASPLFERLKGAPNLRKVLVKGKSFLHRSGYHNNSRWLAQRFADLRRHEDYFWAFQASKFVDEFRIPAPREALAFSFEMAPRYCFEQNGGRLPFGCHAWAKYDRQFWEPFLLK